jgi:uncharacterized membrane protein
MDLGHAVNSAADWLGNAPIIRTVVSNPVFTALLIAALAAVVVMALYHYQIKQAGLKRGLRALLYVFLVVLAVVFVHHHVVMRTARATAAQKGIREVFSGIEQSRAGAFPGVVPVVPMGFAAPEAPKKPAAVPPVSGGDPAAGSRFAGQGPERPPPPAVRPDNVAVADFVITDVVVPTAAGPFTAGPSALKR